MAGLLFSNKQQEPKIIFFQKRQLLKVQPAV